MQMFVQRDGQEHLRDTHMKLLIDLLTIFFSLRHLTKFEWFVDITIIFLGLVG